MTAHILDGKKIAAKLLDKIAQEVAQQNRPPGLAVILVGDDPASQLYVKNKRHACTQVGIKSFAHDLPASTTQEHLLTLITQLNKDPQIDGILVQLPLPAHMDSHKIFEHVSPEKDVDGFHPYNIGRLTQGNPFLRPCTPYGIITLLKEYEVNLSGMNAVVVGASNIVGRPMALELLLAGCTVTICHSLTHHLEAHVRAAELLIVAIGQKGVIQSEWIKPKAVVIDVGMHREPDGKMMGDIDFETAKNKAFWITPVPGGVGPMTIAILLQNTVFAAKNRGL